MPASGQPLPTALLQSVRYEKVRTLATAVSRELKAEHGKRCGTRQQT